MLRAFRSFLFGPSRQQIQAAKLHEARLVWRARVAAYQDAKRRGDTRAQHEAARELRGAAQAALRLEIGR